MVLTGQGCAETQAPISPGLLTVEPKPLGLIKERRFLRLSGLSNWIDIKPFNHSLATLKRAVAERVFFVKENGRFVRPPRPVNFERSLRGVRSQLRRFLPRTVPWTYDEFVESCRGRKKELYAAARDSLFAAGPVTRKDAGVEVFIKYEKTDCTTKADPVPRVISPRSPRFNICVGRFLKKLEPKLFRSLGKLFGSPTVIKGYNAYESARILREKWDSFSTPVAIGLDASRFDQHVSEEALRWEHAIYLDCFPIKRHRDKLAKLLNMQINNRCVGYCPDGKLRYRVRGTRMSGDMNTSLGNCVLMCSMIKAYADHVGLSVQLANNGDDCVVFLEKADLGRFSDGLFEWFYSMGFNMKIEDPVTEFGGIEFCQTKPVFDGNRWVMCRNPSAVQAKDTVFLQNYQSEKQVRNWMHAVGTGGLRLTGCLPVLQNFYRVLQEEGIPGIIPRDYMSWYMRQQADSMDRDFGPVTAEARASFHDSFGITPEEQVLLEEYFDQWSYSPAVAESDHEDFRHRDFPF